MALRLTNQLMYCLRDETMAVAVITDLQVLATTNIIAL